MCVLRKEDIVNICICRHRPQTLLESEKDELSNYLRHFPTLGQILVYSVGRLGLFPSHMFSGPYPGQTPRVCVCVCGGGGVSTFYINIFVTIFCKNKIII